MTKEEAIKTLRELRRETNDSWYEEVYDMAIEALSAEAQNDDLIIKKAKGIQDGLYNIKDGKLSKYYAKGGIAQAYEIVPSAEAVQGEWIGFDECSVCGKQAFDFIEGCVEGVEYLPNFCPNCGARMNGGEKE